MLIANKYLFNGMKKLFHLKGILIQLTILAILININNASGQTGKKEQIAIPEDINKIFQTSCMTCHGNDGGRFPKSKLNFSRWNSYGVAKEIEKASMICSEVKKGKMPPRSARESNPELIPTKEQIDLICKWVETIKPENQK
jgi:mono/diheme cytochrome c family protein